MRDGRGVHRLRRQPAAAASAVRTATRATELDLDTVAPPTAASSSPPEMKNRMPYSRVSLSRTDRRGTLMDLSMPGPT